MYKKQFDPEVYMYICISKWRPKIIYNMKKICIYIRFEVCVTVTCHLCILYKLQCDKIDVFLMTSTND